jgi:hypothetical protein
VKEDREILHKTAANLNLKLAHIHDFFLF